MNLACYVILAFSVDGHRLQVCFTILSLILTLVLRQRLSLSSVVQGVLIGRPSPWPWRCAFHSIASLYIVRSSSYLYSTPQTTSTLPHHATPSIMGFFDDAWRAMDGFGQEAAKQIGPAAAEAWKHADKFGQEQLGPAAAETWKNLDAFGQEAGKHISPAVAETWKHLDEFGQNAGDWVREHPGETAGIVACVFAAPVAIGAANVGLKIAGFTAAGVAAGTLRYARFLASLQMLNTSRIRCRCFPISDWKCRRRKRVRYFPECWSWRCRCCNCPRHCCWNKHCNCGRCDSSCAHQGCQQW